jgi:hypothetical protein
MTTTPITSITDELIESLENGAPALAETCTIPGRMMAGLLTELRRLRAENEALRGDKELLDWLADPENEVGNVQLPTKCVMENMGSLRDAIRQAMQSNTAGK